MKILSLLIFSAVLFSYCVNSSTKSSNYSNSQKSIVTNDVGKYCPPSYVEHTRRKYVKEGATKIVDYMQWQHKAIAKRLGAKESHLSNLEDQRHRDPRLFDNKIKFQKESIEYDKKMLKCMKALEAKYSKLSTR